MENTKILIQNVCDLSGIDLEKFIIAQEGIKEFPYLINGELIQIEGRMKSKSEKYIPINIGEIL